MAKARSPQYPAIGLKEAVEKAAAIYERDYQNQIPRAVIAAHMGYNSLNGKSLGVLSALSKFGLLEGRADESRISDLAVTIIAHPPGTPDRVAALKDAASRPELFGELDARFQGGKASDQAIRSYLLTQKFIPVAADAVVRTYRETKQFVESEEVGYSGVPATVEREEKPMQEASYGMRNAPPQQLPPAVLAENEPFRVAFGARSGLEVYGRLQTEADVDDLMRTLGTWKILLRPVNQIKKPEKKDDSE